MTGPDTPPAARRAVPGSRRPRAPDGPPSADGLGRAGAAPPAAPRHRAGPERRGGTPARALSAAGAPGRAGRAVPAPPLTADDGADEGGVPRAVDQRELELAGPRAQLRRQGGAQAGEAQVQRDAPRPALRRPVEGGGGAGGAQRPGQRRFPAVDVAQDAHVHVENAGRRRPVGHDGAAPGPVRPNSAPAATRAPPPPFRRRLSPGRREEPSLPRRGYGSGEGEG